MSVPKPYANVIAKTDVLKSYKSFSATGGGNKKVGKQVKKFVKKIGNNRILDLYLKYMGIKTLTSATLVPLALIMGKKTFTKVIINFISSQKGGFLNNKIPFLDDPLLGAYLKIGGLTKMSLSPSTLVPLGILMTIYEMYQNKQKGGRVSLPASWFNPNNKETYMVNPPRRNLFKNGPRILKSRSFSISQTGGKLVGSPLSYVNDNLQGPANVPNVSGGVPEPIEVIQTETVGIGDIIPSSEVSTLGTDVNSAEWGNRHGYDSVGSRPSAENIGQQHVGGSRKNKDETAGIF